MRSITSRQNPVVARFRALADTADPTGARVLLDGVHLVREALESGPHFRDRRRLIVTNGIRRRRRLHVAQALAHAGVEVVQAPDAVFAAMSPVRTPSGLVAIATRRPASASEVCAPSERARAGRDRRAGSWQRRCAGEDGRSGRRDRHVRQRCVRKSVLVESHAWEHGQRVALAGRWRNDDGVRDDLPAKRRRSAVWPQCLAAVRIRTPSTGRASGALILGGEGAGLPDEVRRDADPESPFRWPRVWNP